MPNTTAPQTAATTTGRQTAASTSSTVTAVPRTAHQTPGPISTACAIAYASATPVMPQCTPMANARTSSGEVIIAQVAIALARPDVV